MSESSQLLRSVDPALLKIIPARLALRYRVLPLKQEGAEVWVASADPSDTRLLDEVRALIGSPVKPVFVEPSELEEAIRRCYGVGADMVEQMTAARLNAGPELSEAAADLDRVGGESSTVKFVNQLLLEAVQDRATDVHLEPYESQLCVRYRVDGILYDIPVPPDLKKFQSSIISRIKVMASLNVAEHRLPQDGRARIKANGGDLDLRISILPTPHGESVMIRFLSVNVFLGLEQLGLMPDHQQMLERLLTKPHGIIFVSGPTGSGKTTTLYAGLAKLNDRRRKIITIEDPIEYQMSGITQTQIHPKIDLTFAAALRAILRHDPDVIMVGEVRDFETAETAIRTALTGHLVFSTLHTNNAAGCVTRLLDMNIEPYLAASSVECAIAQRLVRLVCPGCGGSGCADCRKTGYKGRTAIFEFLFMDDEIRQLILRRASAGEISRLARSKGMRTLREDGMLKVKEGLTTLEEVMRVTEMEES